MAKKTPIVITADEVELIRARMASMDVQLAEFKDALTTHQRHVRRALLDSADEGTCKQGVHVGRQAGISTS